MNFSTRLKLSSLCAFGILLVLVPLLFSSIAQLRRAEADDVLADDLQTKIFQRTVLRDEFFIRGTEEPRQQWEKVTEATRKLLQSGAHRLADAEESAALTRMQVAFDETVTLFHGVVDRSRQLSDKSEEALHNDEAAKHLFGQLLSKASELQALSGQLQTLTRTGFERAIRGTLTLTGVFVLLVLAATVFSSSFVTRLLRRRLDALRTGTAIIASGDLEHRIPVTGGDELAELGSALNRMTEQVQESTMRLLESEERYRSLFDYSTDAIFLTRPDGSILDANDAACRMLGFNREELKVLSRDRVVDTTDPRLVPALEQRGRTGVFEGELAFLRRDGSRFPVELSSVIFQDSTGADKCSIIVRDITERLQYEKGIMESNQRFSTVFHASPIAIGISTTETGTFVDVNDTFLELFGYTRAEVIGHTSLELGLWPVVSERDRLLGHLRSQGQVRQFEAAFRHSSGRIGHLLVSVELIELGGERFMMGMLSDITSRKNAEKALADMNEELEQQVTERTASLYQANEQLTQEIEERKRVEQELIHHQRRLETMAMELALAEERERNRIAGELHDQVGQRLILGKMKLNALMSMLPPGECEDEAARIEAVIDQSLQDVRSLTFQIRPPILASAGLGPALHWLGEEMRLHYGLTVNFDDDGKPLPLPYEVRSTIFQATRELMLNVVKHAGTGQCRLWLRRQDSAVLIVVEDEGAGFAAGAASAERGKGGFGLFNLKQKIEYLGGSFTIQVMPEGGVRATIRVPLETAPD